MSDGPGSDEELGEKEEQRERYRELLEELRTIIPGVQVLFAFLLTVPFSSRFEDLDDLGKGMFIVALGMVAAAVVVFLVPASYHRLAHRGEREERVRIGSRTTVVGMAFLGTAMGAATFVVTRFILDSTAAGTAVGGGVALAAFLLWYAFPFSRRNG